MQSSEQTLSKRRIGIRHHVFWSLLIVTFITGTMIRYFVFPGYTWSIYQPSDKEYLLAEIGERFDLPQLCEKIPPQAGSIAFFEMSVSSLRSACFYAIAITTKNITLCGQAKPLSTLIYRPEESETKCRRDIQQNRQWNVAPVSAGPEAVRRFINSLGYTDQVVSSYLYSGQSVDIKPYQYYNFLDQLQFFDRKARDEFVQRVLATNAFENQ